MNCKIYKRYKIENDYTLYNGDCYDLIKKIPDDTVDIVVTSPPYCMGKSYERPEDDLAAFADQHEKLFPEIYRVTKPGGSICWQIGYHVKNSVVTPLDYVVLDIVNNKLPQEISQNLVLRNRIAWTFGHGLNCANRFSGRHETLLWFTKGDGYEFDLDSVRVPQKYPGKRYYKGSKKGELSGNPLGKNPSDVWDIPNVKANHIEKTEHPCQFPVAIPQRLIRALTASNAIVLDPFMGSGSSAVAAVLEGRKFIGAELSEKYYKIAEDRLKQTLRGSVAVRDDKPAIKPDTSMAVAKIPEEFISARQEYQQVIMS
jgi:adenine-specific DNA-methyltransferase